MLTSQIRTSTANNLTHKAHTPTPTGSYGRLYVLPNANVHSYVQKKQKNIHNNLAYTMDTILLDSGTAK